MTEIILYHFSKRKNSTKRPTGQGMSLPCLLKSDTTFQNPVFKLKLPLDNALHYNYLQWADHYYFISSTTIHALLSVLLSRLRLQTIACIFQQMTG